MTVAKGATYAAMTIPRSPRAFIRRERRLIRTLTPEWRDTQIAAREAAVEPPPVAPVPSVHKSQTQKHLHTSRPASRPQQILDAAAALAPIGDALSVEAIVQATGIPRSSVDSYIRRMCKQGVWRHRLEPSRRGKYSRTKPCPSTSMS